MENCPFENQTRATSLDVKPRERETGDINSNAKNSVARVLVFCGKIRQDNNPPMSSLLMLDKKMQIVEGIAQKSLDRQDARKEQKCLIQTTHNSRAKTKDFLAKHSMMFLLLTVNCLSKRTKGKRKKDSASSP